MLKYMLCYTTLPHADNSRSTRRWRALWACRSAIIVMRLPRTTKYKRDWRQYCLIANLGSELGLKYNCRVRMDMDSWGPVISWFIVLYSFLTLDMDIWTTDLCIYWVTPLLKAIGSSGCGKAVSEWGELFESEEHHLVVATNKVRYLETIVWISSW